MYMRPVFDIIILRGYHKAVFISVRISSLNVHNGPKCSRDSCWLRTWKQPCY